MSRWALAGLGLTLAWGCTPEPATPCPAWTEADGEHCVRREWVTAALDDALSTVGASDVQVAAGPDGSTLLAWAHATSTESHVVVAESSPDGWTTHTTDDDGAGVEPAVALGPDGRALLAWKQQRDIGFVHLATRDAQGTWQWPPAPVSWDDNAYEPRVRFGPDGEALLLWNQWQGQTFGVALAHRAATDPDGPLVGPATEGQRLSPEVQFTNAPRMAVGPDGEALITWYQAPADDLMVYVSERRNPGAPFSRPGANDFISPPGGPVDSHPEANPWPAVHRSGAAAVVWTQQNTPDDIRVYLATRDPDGAWHRPASLDDALSEANAIARCPQVVFDVEGALVVTWYETRDAHSTVLVRHGEPETIADGAPVSLSGPGDHAVHPALGIDPEGGAVVVWSQRDDEDRWQVVGRLHQPRGSGWLEVEGLSSPQPGLAPTPRLAVDPMGRVVAGWAQGDVLTGRVFVASLP